MYELIISEDVNIDIQHHIKAGNKKVVQKILSLLEEMRKHPRSGSGKPERLKYIDSEYWSRRIDRRHRLSYEIVEEKLIVIAISAFGHYGDK